VPATLTASQPVDSGVDFGIEGRSVRVSQEVYSIFLAREAAGREKIAALQQRLTAADDKIDILSGGLRLIMSFGSGTNIAGVKTVTKQTLNRADGLANTPTR
jgi:ABC-type Fe3+-hydroxamate transport system substrate-binding protein